MKIGKLPRLAALRLKSERVPYKVLGGRLELPRLAALGPKPSVSAISPPQHFVRDKSFYKVGPCNFVRPAGIGHEFPLHARDSRPPISCLVALGIGNSFGPDEK